MDSLPKFRPNMLAEIVSKYEQMILTFKSKYANVAASVNNKQQSLKTIIFGSWRQPPAAEERARGGRAKKEE
jgi:hypothetical protein